MKIYQKIAVLLAAIENCQQLKNLEWKEKHEEALEKGFVIKNV